MGQLHLVSSISELRYLACRTIFSYSSLAKMITGLIKVLPFGCSSLFTGDIYIHIVLKCQVVCLLYLVNVSVLYLLVFFFENCVRF